MFTASYEWLNYARKSKASLSTPNKLSKKTRKLKTSLRNYLHYSFIFYFHSFEKWIKWNWQEDKERNGQKKHGLSPSHHTLYTFCRKDVHWWVLVIYILWVFFDLQNYIRYIYKFYVHKLYFWQHIDIEELIHDLYNINICVSIRTGIPFQFATLWSEVYVNDKW